MLGTILVCSSPTTAAGPFELIRSLLQNNIVGAPVVHRETKWDFDPDVAVRRRDQYYEVYARDKRVWEKNLT